MDVRRLAVSHLPRAGIGVALGALSGMLVREIGLDQAISYSGSAASLVLLFAVLGTGLSVSRLARFARAVPIGLALLWLLVAFTPLARSLVPLTERSDPEEPGDAVFVFSSSMQPDGEPDTGALARMFHGLELVARGRAPAFVVSEANAGSRAEELARAWVGEFRVQAEVVDLGRIANTHEEAVLLGKLARARGWRRIVAVTSPTHSRRACATLEHEGLVAIASPAIETRFDLPALPASGDRLQAFGQVLHEEVGSWTYRRRGWIE
jgi:uncharacterized SAM-binding protein YcdF (DUF218 family)